MVGLPDGVRSLRICLPVSTQCERTKDKRSDRYLSTAICIALSGKNLMRLDTNKKCGRRVRSRRRRRRHRVVVEDRSVAPV